MQTRSEVSLWVAGSMFSRFRFTSVPPTHNIPSSVKGPVREPYFGIRWHARLFRSVSDIGVFRDALPPGGQPVYTLHQRPKSIEPDSILLDRTSTIPLLPTIHLSKSGFVIDWC